MIAPPPPAVGRALAMGLLVAALGVVARDTAPPPPLRVATYNIRRFGREPTDLARLERILTALGADIVAVQEIQSAPLLDDVARRLSTGGRDYRAALSACGGRSEMHVGFLYDAARVRLDGTREFPELDAGQGRCTEGERPGLLGEFSSGGRTLTLLAVHLAAGSSSEHAARRRVQWDRALAILARVPGDKALLGDTNSVGYLDDARGERRFIDERVAGAGLDLVTRPLACSEYFHAGDAVYEPSLLDHVAATPGLARPGSIALHGYCVELGCRPHRDEPPAEFSTVSDHCPVSFDW